MALVCKYNKSEKLKWNLIALFLSVFQANQPFISLCFNSVRSLTFFHKNSIVKIQLINSFIFFKERTFKEIL